MNRVIEMEKGSMDNVIPFLLPIGGDWMLDKVKKLIDYYEEVLRMPHRQEIARELRNEDDLFLLLLYSEMIGIPNPVYYYTLELYPYMIEKFHDWHLRMGMENSPLSGIRCC
ncbi:hypothetical protein SAMN05216389_10844 [Oceanobacillus limi]|uniref:DNA helicase n=2 Tax=Oceanobacillus limi TaxID=930131 RepID=A0A1I0D8V2_9BACI|nr:hypothetical protein SAMN05216389_10844 [Oceanobacillus limi]